MATTSESRVARLTPNTIVWLSEDGATIALGNGRLAGVHRSQAWPTAPPSEHHGDGSVDITTDTHRSAFSPKEVSRNRTSGWSSEQLRRDRGEEIARDGGIVCDERG
jgi:hypothetical protein